MIKIRLSRSEQSILKDMRYGEVYELKYHGLYAYITKSNSPFQANFELDGEPYEFNFYQPPEVKIVKSKN